MRTEVTGRRRERWTIKEIAQCGLFTALITAGAYMKISIPVQPFPMHFTLQFFFVLLSGFLLGGELGCASVCSYLVIGLAGVPIFAAGGGPAYLVRPTFGFLLGFAFASYVTGKISHYFRKKTLRNLLFAAFCGLIVMYLSGMVYFYVISNYVIHMPVTWAIVVVNCFLLTVGGDFLLCVMAAFLARRLIPMLSGLI